MEFLEQEIVRLLKDGPDARWQHYEQVERVSFGNGREPGLCRARTASS